MLIKNKYTLNKTIKKLEKSILKLQMLKKKSKLKFKSNFKIKQFYKL